MSPTLSSFFEMLWEPIFLFKEYNIILSRFVVSRLIFEASKIQCKVPFLVKLKWHDMDVLWDNLRLGNHSLLLDEMCHLHELLDHHQDALKTMIMCDIRKEPQTYIICMTIDFKTLENALWRFGSIRKFCGL